MNWNDYGARFYDLTICRFTRVDPISDQFPHVSTYNYAENELIANIDLHGLQKVPTHLLGQIELNNCATTGRVGATAVVDLGNNNQVSYKVAVEGIGTITGSYSQEQGSNVSFSEDDNLGFAHEANIPQGIKIPKWATRIGLRKAKDALAPQSLEDALSLSEEEVAQNRLIQGVLTDVEGLIENDILTALWDYDGTKGLAKDEEGNSYERKFTSVCKGKLKNLEFSDEGIKFKGQLVISYTDQKCLTNCDEN